MSVNPREQLPTLRGRQTQAAIDAAARAVVARKGILATTLADLAPGARVNVETDMLVKAVRRVIATSGPGGGLSEGFLREHGFA